MSRQFPSGVITGQQVTDLYTYAKTNQFALPAINITGTDTINAALQAARQANSPIIIQMSHGGSQFVAGKALDNDQSKASISGAISAAHHVHQVAKNYDVTVILHSDHAPRKVLPWVDGMLQADHDHFKQHGTPLFSSHMLDLSKEPLDKIIKTCSSYLKTMSDIDITMELEIGITGGEEDGVDNSGVDQNRLYTQPEDIARAYQTFSKISDKFMIAAAFGNVHGTYKPGNVHLKPELLKKHQQYTQQKFNTTEKPIRLVFHGGSGSPDDKIKEAISYGVVKFNIDTDTQWAFWSGVKNYVDTNREYLQSQVGNPDGEDQPNKSYYDPRKWLYAGEQSIVEKLLKVYKALNALNRN